MANLTFKSSNCNDFMNSKTDQVTNSILGATYPARMRTSFLINRVDVTSQGAHPRGELEGGGRVRWGASEEVQRHPQAPRVSQLFNNFIFLSCRLDNICSSSKLQQNINMQQIIQRFMIFFENLWFFFSAKCSQMMFTLAYIWNCVCTIICP